MSSDSPIAPECSMFVLMDQARPLPASEYTAVEIDGVSGDDRYLKTHPGVDRVALGRHGGLVAWIDEDPVEFPDLLDDAPDRAADVELHGPGAPCEALLAHPRAEHVEVFFDIGDPQAAPRGWWHARIWLRRPEPGPLLRWFADPVAFG